MIRFPRFLPSTDGSIRFARRGVESADEFRHDGPVVRHTASSLRCFLDSLREGMFYVSSLR